MLECSVPYCTQDATTRLGYCRPHARMPYHVGLVLHYREDPSSPETVSRSVAEVDLKRGMFRLQGDQGWHYPGDLCLQCAPTSTTMQAAPLISEEEESFGLFLSLLKNHA